MGKSLSGRFPLLVVASAGTRQGIVDCLREKIPDKVIVKDSVVAIDRTSSGKPLVKLHEGNVEEFDLVFGADGVRSVVREAVVGAQYPAKYT
jgi:2-polyprenyl-6-methoxyphenol hydroxylase-like FAD-dependent oxidoreductase